MDIIRLTEMGKDAIQSIFKISDDIALGKYRDCLNGKTIVLFFPESSLRTRVTFEKGIYLLGGQSILFPQDTLEKKEDIKDVCSYLNNWADAVVVRYKEIELIEKMAKYLTVPVINAMTDVNHPCEILSDLYSLSKIREDYLKDRYLFVGRAGNIGGAWKEASEVLGLKFSQCCPENYEMDGVTVHRDLMKAVINQDVILTDSIPSKLLHEFKNYQVTTNVMDQAANGAVLNPCPPFFRGEEVSSDVITSKYFVGYELKKNLMVVSQAILLYSMYSR